MNVRVLIADDEPLNRERLRKLIQAERRTEIVAECSTGFEALDAIRATRPDLVFLDVKMPGLDGFTVLEQVDGPLQPAVVFVTAHDQFAVRAFEVQAVDYLLKPFDRDRFRTAFNRARQRLEGRSPEKTETKVPSVPVPLPVALGRIAVKSQNRIVLISPGEIDWVGASNNYVELHVGPKTHFLRMPLSNLAGQLPGEQFLRISRSFLINLERIKEIHSKSHGDLAVILKDGTRLGASRKYRKNLLRLCRVPNA